MERARAQRTAPGLAGDRVLAGLIDAPVKDHSISTLVKSWNQL